MVYPRDESSVAPQLRQRRRTWARLLRVAMASSFVATLTACGTGDSIYFIPGSGTRPACSEAPVLDVDGTVWFDSGMVMIRTAGCDDTTPGETYVSCALNWEMSQTGNDIDIIVDDEYRIRARLCGDQLYLEGGWWLPVQDAGMCTYDDDSAEEVGIEAEGNVLTVDAGDMLMTGTLVVQGRCRADYEVTLAPAGPL